MNPEIDETIYYLKLRSLEIETLVEQMSAGADNIDAIKKETRDIYEAVNNLHKLIKKEDL